MIRQSELLKKEKQADAERNQTAYNMYGTELLKRNADGESLLYLYNGHSDVTALMTSSGSVAASYYYDEFGSITETTGQANNPFRYAGYQYDEESELYYLNSRYYDPDIARFMQEDTYLGDQADPLSLNLYTYCSNNPLVYVDPTGHWQEGDENLTAEAQAEIIALTNAYYEAETQEEREAIHQQAEAIRNNSKNQDASKNTLIKPDNRTIKDYDEYEENDNFIIQDYIEQVKLSGNQFTMDEFWEMLEYFGITSSTDSSNGSTVTTTTFAHAEIKVSSSLSSDSSAAKVEMSAKAQYLVYYLYDSEFRVHAELDAAALANEFGVSLEDVGTAEILHGSTDLENYWSQMEGREENEAIELLVIHAHGAPDYINGVPAVKGEKKNKALEEYDKKNINNLILLACNAGNIYELNKATTPAAILATKITGNVIAPDGTANQYGVTQDENGNEMVLHRAWDDANKVGFVIYTAEPNGTGEILAGEEGEIGYIFTIIELYEIVKNSRKK